jgi:hypothetical protein
MSKTIYFIKIRLQVRTFGNTNVRCHFTDRPLMRNFFQNTDLVDSQTVGQLLDEIISPGLSERGLVWNGKYLWFDEPKNSVRQVFEYSRLKGETATFVWGVCLDFVPTIFSNKLKFHRTDKSVTQHLFEWTDEYSNSFFGGKLNGGITTHWGKRETKNSIHRLFDKYEQKINKWFDRASTFENLIDIAEQQIKTGKSYNLHNPDQRLVLAFLQAKTNQFDNATKTINQLTLDDGLKELLIKQISQLC